MKSAKLRYCQTAGKYSLFVCVCVCVTLQFTCAFGLFLCSAAGPARILRAFFICLDIIINSHCMYALSSWLIFNLVRVGVLNKVFVCI